MKHVLIIDDDGRICNLLTKIISRAGFSSVSAHPVGDGLKKLAGSFDAVFRYIHRIRSRQNLEPKALSSDFSGAVQSRPWPGNIRELINCKELSAVAAGIENRLSSPSISGMRTSIFRTLARSWKRPVASGDLNPPARSAIYSIHPQTRGGRS